MSRKGENIYKRKDGRWEGRYVRCYDENERPKYGYVYAKTYTEAKNKLIERKGAVNESGAVFDTGSCLYTDVLDAWLQSSRINIKESTYARYIQLAITPPAQRLMIGMYMPEVLLVMPQMESS